MAIEDRIKTDSQNVIAFCRKFDAYEYGGLLQGVKLTPSEVNDRHLTVIFEKESLSWQQFQELLAQFDAPCSNCSPDIAAFETQYAQASYITFAIDEEDTEVRYAIQMYRIPTASEILAAQGASPYRVNDVVFKTTWKAGTCQTSDLVVHEYKLFAPPVVDTSYFLAEIVNFGTEVVPRMLYNLWLTRQQAMARAGKAFVLYGNLDTDPVKEYDLRIYGSGAVIGDITDDIYNFTSSAAPAVLQKYNGFAMGNFLGGYSGEDQPYMMMNFVLYDSTVAL
jgi:hypothetical protein